MIEKENSIKLVMMGARRDDTGIYTLKADNDHGQDQADVEVVVMVEPSKPRGPMKMNDITADGSYTKSSFYYSCDKITTTWIQISRQIWNGFSSNASHQITI